MIKIKLWGFTIFFFACAVAAYGKDSQEIRRSFTVNPGASIALENLNGNITITSWDGKQVEMVAVKTGSPDHFDHVEISTRASASRLTIRTQYAKNRRANVSVRYDLKVPRDVVLNSIKSTSGDIEIAGISGRVTARSISGKVRVSDITGFSTINSISGRVVADNIKGDIIAESVSGDVRIGQIQGSVQAKSVSGDIFINNNSPSETDLAASAVSGAIRFDGRLNPGGQYEIKCQSGDVELNLPADSNFVIYASTSSGSIKSDFDIKENRNSREKSKLEIFDGVVGSGGPIVDLRTFSGNILIRKTR